MVLKYPELSTTALGLSNTDQSMRMILHWPHLKASYIVILKLPKERGKSVGGFPDAHIFEEIPGKDAGSGEPTILYRLSPRFIKGYIDVPEEKLVQNPLFEDNPEIPKPIVLKPAFLNEVGKQEGNVSVPTGEVSSAVPKKDFDF